MVRLKAIDESSKFEPKSKLTFFQKPSDLTTKKLLFKVKDKKKKKKSVIL
jgi:hypothetical protein